MTKALERLYGTLDASTQRRMKFATLGMLFAGVLDVFGIALVLPLMQLLTKPDDRSGIVGWIADRLGSPSDSTLVLVLAGAVLGAFICKGLFSLLFRWWMLGFINHQAASESVDLFERYLGASYPFHLTRNSAELIRTLDRAMVQAYVVATNAVLIVITELVTVVCVLVVLVAVRPIPAVAAAVYFGLIGVTFQRLARRKAREASDELMAANRDSVQAALQGLGGIKEVLVRGTAPFFLDGYRSAQHRQAGALRAQLYLGDAPRYVVEMMFVVGVAIMSGVIFAGGDTQSGAATLGLFVAAGFRLLPSFTRMLGSMATLRTNKKGIELVLADFEQLEAPEAPSSPVAHIALSDRIVVDSLEYRYPGNTSNVLNGVSFQIRAGQAVALVGASGAGKTTVVDVLLGLLEPTAGTVTIDGVNLADVRTRWQRSLGLVPQDVYLFDDTLRANIAFGETDDVIDDERMAEAVRRAQLEELVADRPEGLDMVVGERGVRLSRGQLQRIGIARALYLRPQLLVLDEATSALDNETERKVTATIESLKGEVTMVVVAHRLSTVRNCDQVVFMNNGRCETSGTFDEVRANNPAFARLVELGSLESLDTVTPT